MSYSHLPRKLNRPTWRIYVRLFKMILGLIVHAIKEILCGLEVTVALLEEVYGYHLYIVINVLEKSVIP